MYIGLDVHKKISYYAMVDGKGTEVLKGRFPTTYDGLSEFTSTLPEGARVAIVASSIFVYEYLGERGVVQRSYLLVLWVQVPPLQFSVGNVSYIRQ